MSKKFIDIQGIDLRCMRLTANKTTQEMAEKVGVKRATYENWEKDIGAPNMNQFIELCEFCNFDMNPIREQFKAAAQKLKNINIFRKRVYKNDK